jgi:hypothetical protein
MEANSNGPAGESSVAERRRHPRYELDCGALIAPMTNALRISGTLVDLSLSGCRVVIRKGAQAGVLGQVEVQFQLRGFPFRIVGAHVGSRGAESFGIRFMPMSECRQMELAEALAELAAMSEAAASPGSRDTATDAIIRSSKCLEVPLVAPLLPEVHPERRLHVRHAVNGTAKLLMVKGGINLPGRVLNVSLGGCRFKAEERFNVGIYVRVEAEFCLYGKLFRVAGVSQSIIDRNTVGVRFLDLSARRLAELTELISEIAEDEAGVVSLACAEVQGVGTSSPVI